MDASMLGVLDPAHDRPVTAVDSAGYRDVVATPDGRYLLAPLMIGVGLVVHDASTLAEVGVLAAGRPIDRKPHGGYAAPVDFVVDTAPGPRPVRPPMLIVLDRAGHLTCWHLHRR